MFAGLALLGLGLLRPSAADEAAPAYKYKSSTDTKLQCWLAQQEHRVAADTVVWPGIAERLPVTPLWEDPELALWLRMQAFLLLTGRQGYLDVGCGFGRIILKFRWIFASTTCLEPDTDRKALAEWFMSKEQWFADRSVRFLNTKFMAAELAPESFDAISCIHVVQHIPSDEPAQWFGKMWRLLKPDGVLVIATTHEMFDTTFSFEDDPVTQEVFDRAAANPEGKVLPVHGFTKAELAALVRSAGFVVLEHREFQFRPNGVPVSQFIIAAKSATSRLAGESPPSPHIDEVYNGYLDQTTQMRLRNVRKGVDQC